jgi:PEP-CTERM motif-containing protein
MSKLACLSRLCGLVALVLFATASWADSVILVPSQAALAPNDSTTWGQLGPDGAIIPSGAMATSVAGNTITIAFGGLGGGTNGLTSVECPAAPSCSWTGGFTAGDTLIWAFDGSNNSGSGPLTASFSNAVSGAGLALQSDALGSFSGTVQVQFTDSSFSAVYTVLSDASGDPVFLGLVDTTGANIKSITFDIVGSGSDHDFAADTLYSVNPAGVTPEPASFILFATGLAGFGWKKLRRPAVGS